MDAALWAGGAAFAVLLALVVVWRLRRAARTMRRILAEEHARTLAEEREATLADATDRVEDQEPRSLG